MTREEAIDRIKAYKRYLMGGNPIWSVEEVSEAFDMAIESLTHDIRTDTHGVCSDYISRADAIEAVDKIEIERNETLKMLPKNIATSFPLYICEECSDCVPTIDLPYVTEEYDQYEITCDFAIGCRYVHERLTKEPKDCNGRK